MHTPSAPTRSRNTHNSPSHSQPSNMPTKMAKFCREKGVLITVYEEKPRRRRVSSNHHHHHQVHHHHHHHHYLHHTNKNSGSGNGYNRRAELLRYSQSLRESVRPAASSSSSSSSASIHLLPKPLSPKNQTIKTVALHRRPSHGGTPTCMGNWKILIPSFIISLLSPKAKKDKKKKKHSGSTTNKMKALIKSLEVQKKSRTIIPKLFSSLRKHR